MTEKKHEGSGLDRDLEGHTAYGYCSRSGEMDISKKPMIAKQRKGVRNESK